MASPTLNGHEFEQALGDGEGQESLVCCSPWGGRDSDMTYQLNKNNAKSEGHLQRPEILPDFSDLDQYTHFFLMLYLMLTFLMVKCTTQLYPVKYTLWYIKCTINFSTETVFTCITSLR